MYKIGDKVETIYGACVIENHDKDSRIYHTKHTKTQRLFMFYEDSTDILGLYRTAHEKLIEMGWEYSDRQSGKLHKVYYTENPNDNQKYELVFDKYEHGWVYNLNNEIIVDLTLSHILTQYLEEMEGKE